MKTSAIFVAAAAALASAQAPPEGTNGVNCAKANASYCLGGDIIVRCDGSKNGVAGRCSDNVAGYPPLGGVAECYQSSELAGDAACQKNCVVYAQPSSFTLAADQCTPSFTAPATATATAPTTLETTAVATAAPTTLETTAVATAAPTTLETTAVATAAPTGPVLNSTVSTAIYPLPTQTISVVTPPAGTGVAPPPQPPIGGNQTSPSGTNVPVPPTTTGPSTVPTNAAANNRAAGVLAVAGLVAAYFI